MADTNLARTAPTRTRATLTDADLDNIEAEMDDSVPVYVPTLIRDLREARELLAALVETRR